MFDEFIRELDSFPSTMELEISMPLDDKGYFDRRCPRQECQVLFKVMFDDWGALVSDDAEYCPKCGAKDDPDEFYTPEQREYIEQSATAHVADRLGQVFTRAAGRTRPQRISSGFFDITMDVSYQSSPMVLSLPPDAHGVLRQDLRCKKCGCRWSVIGTGYFCPACKHNSVLYDFDSTVTTAIAVVDGLEAIKGAVAETSGDDAAADVARQLVEDQVENLFSAFQRLSEALFRELPNATSFRLDLNLFQRLDHASDLWHSAAGQRYSTYLSETELDEMKVMMQRRHKLTHTQGIVDQRYIDQSGDHSYAVGQRLVIRESQVRSLAAIVKKLAKGLREAVQASTK